MVSKPKRDSELVRNPAIQQLLAGLAIGNLRRASGMNHLELADRAKIQRPRYSQIENGKVVATEAELERIHAAIAAHDTELEKYTKALVAGAAGLDDSQLRRLAEVVRKHYRPAK